MADKRKAVGGGWLTHTLHVWPAREVTADSAYWPLGWHLAFERAARQLGERVACCVLGGLPICPEPISMELLPAGRLTFSVHVSGTSIHVVIWAFEGPDDPEPDAPGPNGGVRRSTADGLVLGLRGTGKSFSIATFYGGRVPPIPVGQVAALRVLALQLLAETMRTGRDGDHCWRAGRLPSLDAAASRTTATSSGTVPPQATTSRGAHYAPASPPRTTATSALFAKEQAEYAVRPGDKAQMCLSDWIEASRKNIRALSSFDCPNTYKCNPERAFALSASVDGTTIPDHRFGPGKPLSTGATSLGLH